MTLEFDLAKDDPLDLKYRECPFPVYKILRDEMPVYYHQIRGFYILTRYDDVKRAASDYGVFSNKGQAEMSGATPELIAAVRQAEPHRSIDVGEMVHPSITGMDPPEHKSWRGIIDRVFIPPRMAAFEGRVRKVVDEVISEIEDVDAFEVRLGVGAEITMRVIVELLGLDQADRPMFKHWSDEIFESITSHETMTGNVGRMAKGLADLGEFFARLAEERRHSSRNDLVSIISRAQEGELKLSNVDVANLVRLILLAGNETTSALVANGTKLLLEHSDELTRLVDNPDMLPAAIEEMLRLESPFQGIMRKTTEDVSLHGITIPMDSLVLCSLGAANRDERAFPDPDRFVLNRTKIPNKNQIAFGYGPHHCLGVSLARLEGRCIFERLLPILQHFEIAPGPVEYMDNFISRQPIELNLVRKT